MTTLDLLRPGERAEVTGISFRKEGAARRLLDMGLVPGVKLELLRTAPFGDPLEIRVRGFNLVVRKEDAALIGVRQ